MALFNYECDEVKRIIEEVSPNYPQLTTYEKEWLYFYKYEYTPGTPVELEYETINVNPTGMVPNAIPFQYKSAILKGNTWVNLIDDTKNTKNKWLVYGEPTIDENGIWYFQSASPLAKYAQQIIPVKNNTTYTVFLKCKNKNTNKNNNAKIGLYLESNDGGPRIEAAQENILSDDFVLLKCKITTTTHKSVSFRMHARNLIGEVWFKEPIFIEGDYIDQNIPYFEGMQSVKMPVLTTSNEDGTKTNILTVNEDITLRSNGDIYDELNLLTGRLTQRIGENNEVLSQEVVKTVALTPLNKPYEGTNHYELTSNIPCEAILEVPVVSTGEQTLEEIND